MALNNSTAWVPKMNNNETNQVSIKIEVEGDTWIVSATAPAVSSWLETWEILPKEEA